MPPHLVPFGYLLLMLCYLFYRDSFVGDAQALVAPKLAPWAAAAGRHQEESAADLEGADSGYRPDTFAQPPPPPPRKPAPAKEERKKTAQVHKSDVCENLVLHITPVHLYANLWGDSLCQHVMQLYVQGMRLMCSRGHVTWPCLLCPIMLRSTIASATAVAYGQHPEPSVQVLQSPQWPLRFCASYICLLRSLLHCVYLWIEHQRVSPG